MAFIYLVVMICLYICFRLFISLITPPRDFLPSFKRY
nr:p4 protein [Areca palm velarivirus 1]UOV22854.1 p4 protein [Areca palm velarivirus 1]UOV22887.1 p4 protein [Areca palm velarivirus 1]UOV22931.1 p4 protein [Areca palm velarivirus 1]UOV22964.1 p4 protein [Areca palm velarivirus 1]